MPPKRKNVSDSESEKEESDFSDNEHKKKVPAKAKAKKQPTPKKLASASQASVKGSSPKSEIVKQKSPAEFFAENQNIAGFDNPGKSLYTTIRELVENALDASESISVLPAINLTIEEMTTEEFNTFRGLNTNEVVDAALFANPAPAKRQKKQKKEKPDSVNDPPVSVPAAPVEVVGEGAEGNAAGSTDPAAQPGEKKKKGRPKDEPMYYRVSCQDNGVGMSHAAIPEMLGRVLSGSKYGVRQTRGKFGLGAKMALIWAKKSTGMPIEVFSGHCADVTKAPEFLSHVVLDIDIYKNEPNVHKNEKLPNPDGTRGSTLTVVTGGSWATYRVRIMNYLQQLAIITPYAELNFKFLCKADPSRDLVCKYARRSNQMPPQAGYVKHHPSSVNNLLLRQLIDNAPANCKLVDFLTSELSCVDRSIAKRIIKELGDDWTEGMHARKLTVEQVHQLTQLLKSVTLFKPPDGSCLSPAGEYNLRLGIQKEMSPAYVATYTEKPSAFEGHPFIVEAGVSIGGQDVKEGINVFRFANRIPLLFEAGGDVVTRQAVKNHWNLYKIDQKRDKIGVFVSIVSTKIPFKGTGKEYIGDDIEEIKKAVKHALQMCCGQLRVQLVKRNALNEQRLRKKLLTKYIPDVSRAIFGVLEAFNIKKEAAPQGSVRAKFMGLLKEKAVSEEVLSKKLFEAVYAHDSEAAQEENILLGKAKHHLKQHLYLVREKMIKTSENNNHLKEVLVFQHPVFSFTLLPSAEQLAFS